MRQNGQTVMKLSDLTDDFCLKQGNRRESDYFQYLVFAKWAWKQIYRETIWSIRSVALEAEHKEGHHTIVLPDDCERLVNISVVDRFGKKHPLTPDSDFNTVRIKCEKCKCSCNKCNGENSLCSVIDNITVTYSTVSIQGTPYQVTTWIRYQPNGELQQEQLLPVYNASTETVEYFTQIKTLCNMDADDKGCIKPTEPNMWRLTTYCGWDRTNFGWNGYFDSNNPYKALIPAVYNYYGYWNKNAADPSIIHLFRNEWTEEKRPYDEHPNHHHEGFGTIIVTYQTNGEIPDTEILVPEYAVEAVQDGMLYQKRKYNPKDGDRDGTGRQMFEGAKKKVLAHLNPIRMEVVAKLQTQARPW